MGNEHPSIAPYAPFACAGGEIVIAVGNDRQFAALCSGLGVPELAEDARFTAAPDRSGNRDQLRPLLESALAARTAAEWFEVLTPLGVPCGPIQGIAGGVAFAERLGLEPVADAGTGDRSVPVVRNPVRYSGHEPQYDLAPPQLDEHRALVLDWLARSSG